MAGNCKLSEIFGTMVCDTPVPYYDMGVSCGLPNDFGDIPPEMIMAPHELVGGKQVFIVHAEGDSMEGVGIYDGDMVMMESVHRLNNRDIVYVTINGEQVMKTYYLDDKGRHWLLPANEKYDAILLTEDMDVRFSGRLLWHMKQPRDTTQNIRQSIERFLEKQRETEVATTPRIPTYDEVVEALLFVASLVTAGRHWLGACRVLMDCGFIYKNRYDKFCELVCSVLPAHTHLPKAAELQRMAVLCFSKPFVEWKDETAPVHGKHYVAYHEVGEVMLQKLP